MNLLSLSIFSLAAFLPYASTAGDICNAAVIAELKNVTLEREQTSIQDKVYYSFCSKEKDSHISIAIGQDSGQLSDSKSITDACLTGNKSFFASTASESLISTLPESVQRDLVFACGQGGLQFTGTDVGGSLVVTGRYQQVTDGLQNVGQLMVSELLVTDDTGTVIDCTGSLAIAGKAISSGGTTATCPRNGNTRALVAQLSTTTDAGDGPGKTIRFSGRKFLGISYSSPNIPYTDGRSWKCIGNNGAYEPAGTFDCHWYGSCNNSRKKIAYCSHWFGTHFEVDPGGDVWLLHAVSYKGQKDKSKCINGVSSEQDDFCVISKKPIVGATSTMQRLEFDENDVVKE